MSYSMGLKSKKRSGGISGSAINEQSTQTSVPMTLSTELSLLKSRERAVTGDITKGLHKRYGVDMNKIRIFEDEGLRERFGQRGYAKGNEIHLAKGEYSPNTRSGQDIIMHEAGHIVQQGSGMVSGSGIVQNARLEAQADSGFAAPANFSMPTASASSAIQGRDPWREDPRIKQKAKTEEKMKEAQAKADKWADREKRWVGPFKWLAKANHNSNSKTVAEHNEKINKLESDMQANKGVNEDYWNEKISDSKKDKKARKEKIAKWSAKAADGGWFAKKMLQHHQEKFDEEKKERKKLKKHKAKDDDHGIAHLTNFAEDKWNHLKRSHYRAVRDWHENKSDFNRIGLVEKIKYMASNPLAMMFGEKEYEKGSEGLQDFIRTDDKEKERFKDRKLPAADDPIYDSLPPEAKPLFYRLAEMESGGSGQSAGGSPAPVQSGDQASTGNAPAQGNNSASENRAEAHGEAPKSDDKTDESSTSQTLGNVSEKIGYGGTVSKAVEKGAGLFGTDADKILENRENLFKDGVQSRVEQYNEDNKGKKIKDKFDKNKIVEEAQNEAHQSTSTLTNQQRNAGAVSSFAAAAGSTAATAQNIVNAVRAGKNGDTTKMTSQILDAGGNAVKTGGHAYTAMQYLSKNADKVIKAEKVGIPVADAIASAIATGKSIMEFGSATDTKESMKELKKDKRFSKYEGQIRMTKRNARANQIESGVSIGTNLVRTAGNLAGAAAPVAGEIPKKILNAAADAVDTVKDVGVDEMKKRARTKEVNKTLKLDDRIKDKMAKNPGMSYKEAKHDALMDMGYQSGKRKEAFQNILMNRAIDLKQDAEQGGEEAQVVLEKMGLKMVDGHYDLQSIAEKMGMDVGTSWREQMEKTRKPRESLKDIADNYQREHDEKWAAKDEANMTESADDMNKYRKKNAYWAKVAENHGGPLGWFAKKRANANQEKYEKANKEYIRMEHNKFAGDELRSQNKYFRDNREEDPGAESRKEGVRQHYISSNDAEAAADQRRVDVKNAKISESQADVDKWKKKLEEHEAKGHGIRAKFAGWRLRKNTEKLEKRKNKLQTIQQQNAVNQARREQSDPVKSSNAVDPVTAQAQLESLSADKKKTRKRSNAVVEKKPASPPTELAEEPKNTVDPLAPKPADKHLVSVQDESARLNQLLEKQRKKQAVNT